MDTPETVVNPTDAMMESPPQTKADKAPDAVTEPSKQEDTLMSEAGDAIDEPHTNANTDARPGLGPDPDPDPGPRPRPCPGTNPGTGLALSAGPEPTLNPGFNLSAFSSRPSPGPSLTTSSGLGMAPNSGLGTIIHSSRSLVVDCGSTLTTTPGSGLVSEASPVAGCMTTLLAQPLFEPPPRPFPQRIQEPPVSVEVLIAISFTGMAHSLIL